MKNVTLKINKNSYNLKFGISCLRLLGEKWKIATINGVLEKLSELDKLDPDNIAFDLLGILEDVVIAAIQTNSTNVIVESDMDGLLDWLIENPNSISEIFEALLNSMPKAASEKKPIPAKIKK